MKYFTWLICLFFSATLAYANPDTVQTASGLRYTVLQKGNGPQVSQGARVLVHYTGRFANGKVFDTSEGQKPIKFKAGTGEVIAGWDEMLLLMRAGQEVEVMIPARLAYGAHGVPDPHSGNNGYRIPPNTDLIFRMKVVEVKQ
ncbi:FKBP-type peptidyl-prolyl cis-trans isomerase [Adhaeribacter sp. BT258]|uniref:Peptidyl-prolyl cis-trans isomerase n=1 Tax=Adhaeribacter terrigena TaxID=2793070 RepID=A0ABS1C5A3_9BACT|nr:FKBP-type peptidyl-prolyl cis-trans isomerase [Adhaeribacter terrigena]MBK0404534.1 FKBP-type peptidyl-prolyl cis-trans isomerase [Adhaeribacter terrigena]